MRFKQILSHALLTMFFAAAWMVAGYAQCDVGIQTRQNDIEFTIKTPQPGSTYTWAADGGLTGSGLTFTVPRGNQTVKVYRDGAEASRLPIMDGDECEGEIGLFRAISPDPCQPCTFKFIPNSFNVLSHFWSFGDVGPSSTSKEAMPTHTYTSNGSYSVVHLITYVNSLGQVLTSTCTSVVVVNCGAALPPAIERIECCQLYLRFCPSSADIGCSHLWEMLNASGIVCKTSTDASPDFALTDFNTYDNPAVRVRHTVSCPNGVVTVETLTHTFSAAAQGIFVGNPSLPVTQISQYTAVGLGSCLNNNQLLFPQTGVPTVTGWNVYVQGILEINHAATVYFNNDQVCFANDAGVDIASTRKWAVQNNSKLFNGCTKAWRGIELRAGTSVTPTKLDIAGYNGILSAPCTVTGAVFAVRTNARTDINLSNSTYAKNYVSVYADGAFTSYIYKNTFSGGSLPELGITSVAALNGEANGYSQQGPFAGIYIKPAPAAQNIVFNNGLINYFKSMANGYYLVNTRSTIRNQDFQNQLIISGYQKDRTGHGIYYRHDAGTGQLILSRNNFASLERAVRAISGIPGTQVQITDKSNTANVNFGFMLEQKAAGRFNNTFLGGNGTVNSIDSKMVGVGFEVENGASLVSTVNIAGNTFIMKGKDGVLLSGPNPGMNNVTVKGNTFTTAASGVRSGVHLLNFQGALVDATNVMNLFIGSSPYRSGVWLENSRNCTIKNNVVNSNFLPGNLPPTRGIFLENSTNNLLEDNRFNNTGWGLWVFGSSICPDMIRCNRFSSNAFGIYYSAMAQTGDQNNTGNKWEGPQPSATNGLIGTKHEDKDKDFVQLSAYLTLQGNSTQYPQTIETKVPDVQPNDWFALGSENTCGQEPPPAITEGETAFAGSGIPIGNAYEAGYNWFGRRLLYRKLRENPALASANATVQSFYQAAPSNTIGTYDLVGEHLQAVAPLSAAAEQQLQTYLNAASAAAATMTSKEELITTANPTPAELETLQGEYNTAADALAQTNAQIESLLAAWRSTVAGQISSAAAENSVLSATQGWETREKTINNLLLGKVRNAEWLTGADLAYIRETAEMCPWDGGLAVYLARALWGKVSDEELTFSDCGDTYRQGTQSSTATATEAMHLYPNPASTFATLDIQAAWTSEGAVQYHLFNLFGIVVHAGMIEAGVSHANLSLSGLPNGLYMCQVTDKDRVLGTAKLSVIKN